MTTIGLVLTYLRGERISLRRTVAKPYASLGSAIGSAKRRLTGAEPTDEVHIHRCSFWDHANCENYLGKVAFRHDGRTLDWFPRETT